MHIVIIGAGVVGRATGVSFSRLGHEVTFCDINTAVLRGLAGDGFDVVESCEVGSYRHDVTMLCIGTPTIRGEIALDDLRSACETVGIILQQSTEAHLVVVRSTVPPGTTEDVLIPILENISGKAAGRDFRLCHNPEFLREASATDDALKPWIVVIGAYDQASGRALHDLYEPGVSPVVITSVRTSEMVKYTSNLYNATKISFTNEIWLACQQLGIDGDEVMQLVSRSAEAMWHPGYGTKGGYSYGGSCLPKDTEAFLAFARQRGLVMTLLEAAVEVNDSMALENEEAPVWLRQ